MEAKTYKSVQTVSRDSKKIKKSSSKKQEKASQFLESPKSKKYETYPDNLKETVVTDLRKALMKGYQNEFQDQSIFLNDLLTVIDKISLEHFNDYNQIIQKILARHIPSYENTTANGAAWRKKIKSWIKNLNKPERRGGKVIPPELSEKFNKDLTEFLQTALCRKFATLKNFILEFLKENQQDQKKAVKTNTCSKHWWFNYQKENPEIGALWESLELERTINKKGSNKKSADDEVQSTDISSPSVSSDPLSPFELICEGSPNSSTQDNAVIVDEPQFEQLLNFDQFSTPEPIHEESPMNSLQDNVMDVVEPTYMFNNSDYTDDSFTNFQLQSEDRSLNQFMIRPRNFFDRIYNLGELDEQEFLTWSKPKDDDKFIYRCL